MGYLDCCQADMKLYYFVNIINEEIQMVYRAEMLRDAVSIYESENYNPDSRTLDEYYIEEIIDFSSLEWDPYRRRMIFYDKTSKIVNNPDEMIGERYA